MFLSHNNCISHNGNCKPNEYSRLKFNERYVKDEHLNSLRYGKLMIMADPNPDGTFLRVS